MLIRPIDGVVSYVTGLNASLKMMACSLNQYNLLHFRLIIFSFAGFNN